MAPLYDAKGNILKHTKEKPPKLGNAYGDWAGRDLTPFELPGGGFLQFDLSKLRLSDYRQMTTHYQINSSLSMLAFMQHQVKWKIEHPNKKVRHLLTENLEQIWTMLTRGMSHANWSGYSPNVLEWDNYDYDKSVRITKVKDLLPEEALVNWKIEEGYAPPGKIKPKFKTYDGINQYGRSFPIPVESTFWYPLLMENGNYYGRKLLRSVYTSYFFSMLIHLYANRYYERFGEPTPIGRAPFDDDIEYNGATVSGQELIMNVLQNLRSRGVVTLPSDRTQDGTSGQSHFDYDIEYLESQMRGADFERMLTRYDQEMSLGTFTPLLLQQTADVGSYNLGGLHYQMYLTTQNAMNDDKAQYIRKYILRPIQKYNFSQGLEPAKIVFEKQDNQKMELVKMIIQALISKGEVKFDLDEIGQAAGLSLEQVQALKQPTQIPPGLPGSEPPLDGTPGSQPNGDASAVPAGQTPKPSKNSADLRNKIYERVRNRVANLMTSGNFGPDADISIPFVSQLEADYGKGNAERIKSTLTNWTSLASNVSWESANSYADQFISLYDEAVR